MRESRVEEGQLATTQRRGLRPSPSLARTIGWFFAAINNASGSILDVAAPRLKYLLGARDTGTGQSPEKPRDGRVRAASGLRVRSPPQPASETPSRTPSR